MISQAAAHKLHRVAFLLIRAYEDGEANGGSVEWSDVDRAFEAAQEAMKLCRPRFRKKPLRVKAD